MGAFEIIPGDPASRVILHVPHSSTYIPADVRSGIVLSDEQLAAELDAITDARTDDLAEAAARRASVRPWIFVNRCSRLVVDPERFPDEREELNAVGRGAVYERASNNSILRTPGAEQRERLLADYFRPYSESIAQLVSERLMLVSQVTIVDVHSYPAVASEYELHGVGPRPAICIGTDTFHTPRVLSKFVIDAVQDVLPDCEIEVNTPFSGCYVPLDQYRSNAAVSAVMLELRRDIVAKRFDAVIDATAAVIDELAEPVWANDVG